MDGCDCITAHDNAISKPEGLAVASTAPDDPSSLLGDYRDRNAQ